MINLNAGNLWTDEYLSKVIELNDQHKDDGIRVSSIFGSIAKLTPTARSSDRLPYMEWSHMDKFVDRAKKNNIKIRYTLNASCLGSMQDFTHVWKNKLAADIKELHQIGIDEWTITSPLLMMTMKEMFPQDFFEVSTIAEIDTPLDVRRWQECGALGVNLSTNINRDFTAIRDIVSTGTEVSILANEACLYHCAYRRDCYNLSSHDSRRGEDLFDFYPFRYCNEVRMADTSEWLKAKMVLPQWMSIYNQQLGINWFKVAFRTHPFEVAIPILEAYMNQYYGGNYLSLWPTIKKLGDTAEPADNQYISCSGLDDVGYFEHISQGLIKCNGNSCAKGCTYCQFTIDRTQGK